MRVVGAGRDGSDGYRGDMWAILRTSGGRTLALEESLVRADFDVWTPKETQHRRRPRSTIKVERQVAIIPTFVFVRARHLPAMARIRTLIVNPHPAFSIFRDAGRIPLIGDSDIAALRIVEDRARLREERAKERALQIDRMRSAPRFDDGTAVRVTDGAWAGMTGIVNTTRGKLAVVSFGGNKTAKIAAWLLTPDDVFDCAFQLDAAA